MNLFEKTKEKRYFRPAGGGCAGAVYAAEDAQAKEIARRGAKGEGNR